MYFKINPDAKLGTCIVNFLQHFFTITHSDTSILTNTYLFPFCNVFLSARSSFLFLRHKSSTPRTLLRFSSYSISVKALLNIVTEIIILGK